MPEFRRTLREYREYSKRDDVTIVNTKAFYIARGAVRETHKADPSVIDRTLSQLIKEHDAKNAGKLVKVKRFGRFGKVEEAPLVSLLINAERGRKGMPGLYGSSMRAAVRRFIPRRKQAAGFIASGWIPSIKAFEPLAEKKGSAPALDRSVKQVGRPKGRGIPADKGQYVPTAILQNMAVARGLTGGTALEKWAQAGLQAAFNNEISSMKEYIEQKKQETANKFKA